MLSRILTLCLSFFILACDNNETVSTSDIVGSLPTVENDPLLLSTVPIYYYGYFTCSGVVVAPNLVLTAAHCIHNRPEKNNISIRLDDFQTEIFAEDAQYYYEGKNANKLWPIGDIAWIKLNTNLPESIPVISIAKPSLHDDLDRTLVNLYGYGSTAYENEDVEVLRYTQSEVYKIYWGGPFKGILVIDSPVDYGPCRGDSGGPLIHLASDGTPYLYGLVSGADSWLTPDVNSVDDPCQSGQATYNMPWFYKEWIETSSGVSLNEPLNDGELPPKKEVSISDEFASWCEATEISTEQARTIKAILEMLNASSCEQIQEELRVKNGIINLSEQFLTELTPLQNLDDITELSLNKNKIRSLPNLSLRSILNIDLSENEIDIIDFNHLPQNIDSLNLRSNVIQSIIPREQSSHLTWLNLSSNQLENVSGLENLLNLRALSMSHNQIYDLNGIETLQNLEILNLSYNQIEEYSALESLENIEILSIYNNPIDDFVCPYPEEDYGDVCQF